LTQLLGIKYPLVQAPVLGVSTPEMESGNKELTTLWAAQSASLAKLKPSVEIFCELIAETERLG